MFMCEQDKKNGRFKSVKCLEFRVITVEKNEAFAKSEGRYLLSDVRCENALLLWNTNLNVGLFL